MPGQALAFTDRCDPSGARVEDRETLAARGRRCRRLQRPGLASDRVPLLVLRLGRDRFVVIL
jgi:hypothetical protein